MSELYDITIVGGGPVGLFAAFYAHLRQAKVKIIDSLPQLGGQPAILYPEKKILDVPGFTNLTGEELTQRLIEQLETFQTDICLNETVLDIVKADDGFTITTSKAQHQTKTIIIAMGGGAFKPRALELDDAESYSNLHYHVSNISQYAGKKVVILGGGDSAVDWALAFEKIAETSLVHRRDNFRALEHSVEELKTSSVEIKTHLYPVDWSAIMARLPTWKSAKSRERIISFCLWIISLSTTVLNPLSAISKIGAWSLTVTKFWSTASKKLPCQVSMQLETAAATRGKLT